MRNLNVYNGPEPDAEIFDISQWPVIFIRFPQLGMPNRTDRLLNGLTTFLQQQQRVVFVWIPARHGHEREPHEEEKQSTRWMKQQKVALHDYCAGYVYLTTDPEVRASLTTLFPKLKKIMPFPKTLADDRQDAWERAQGFLADGAREETLP